MKTKDFIEKYAYQMLGDTPPTGDKWCSSVGYMDGKIYSYGRHYPLLWKVTTPSGRNILVCNREGYSNTISKHIGWCWRVADVYVRSGFADTYAELKAKLEAELAGEQLAYERLKRKDTKKAAQQLNDIAQLQGFLTKLD